jgi:nitrous oxidase accessory protein
MRTLATSVVLLALASAGEARTWTVGARDADFPLIAPAIAAAGDGDTIRITGGTYREDIVLSKRLAIIGIGNPTVFGRSAGTVIAVRADGCEVRGLTIELSGTGATNEMDAGIRITSNGNVIAGNRLRRVFYGIVVANASNNSITDNDIEGLAGLPFGKRGDGIYLYRAPSNFVARNRISGARDAIYFQYAPNGVALDNVITRSRYGLHDMFSDGTRIEGNTFADSSAGANIMNSRDIVLTRNRFVGNGGVPGIGLTLKDCDASTIRGNEIAGNTRGLLIEGSSRNRFIGNTFRGNDTAVTLFSSAEGNAFGANAFIDNWSDLVVSGRDSRTAWAIDGRGNYWDKYRGFDFDGDGVGDAPHPIAGAFERIEGVNPAARIFLRSPAAAGLEMAARLSGRADADAVDPRPLARRGR